MLYCMQPVVVVVAVVLLVWAGVAPGQDAGEWEIGAPIVTYWCGPTLTDAVAEQMVQGGFNLVWCSEQELDVAQRHGLRAQLRHDLLHPTTLEDETRRVELDRLIERVRRHPALYCYHVGDEPSVLQFPAVGKMVKYLAERDPSHMAYVNLFPTYASSGQLATSGDMVTAYDQYLTEYCKVVKPALISYDHYQFMRESDRKDYFLNLAMIGRAAQTAQVPFMNIVQASSWDPLVRVPNVDEVRYLVFTTVAYGAEGISYYIYCCVNHDGGIARPDGTPTELYHALKIYNPMFTAIAKQLQPLRSLGVYHTTLREPGCEALPSAAVFRVEGGKTGPEARGFLLGMFGAGDRATHVVVVNLDYASRDVATVIGPGALEVFDAERGQWGARKESRVELNFAPGGGTLVRWGR